MRAPAAALAVLVLAACSSSTAHRATVTTTTAVRTVAACSTATRFGADGTHNEVRGASAHGQVWGLALGPGHVPPRAGDTLKIVWRVTGRGPLRVVFTAPDGRGHPLTFGPEAHAGGSTYHRPGGEWGTGFRFTTTGCWHIHLARDDTAGDVWIDV